DSVDIENAVRAHGNLRWIRDQSPHQVQGQQAAQQDEGQHSRSLPPRRLNLIYAQRQQEGQQALRVKHVGRTGVVSDPRRQSAVEPHPHEAFDELVRGKEAWHRCQQHLAPVLHLAQRGYAHCAEHRTPNKVRCRGKAHWRSLYALRWRRAAYIPRITCSVTQSVRIASSIGHRSDFPSSTALTKFSTTG